MHAPISVFFFQAEDGIRDGTVTGVQTCALPIFHAGDAVAFGIESPKSHGVSGMDMNEMVAAGQFREIAEYCLRDVHAKIGRASCRERVETAGVAVGVKR